MVVGAGPAGSACALTLARYGSRVLLLERDRTPGGHDPSGAVLFGDYTAGYGLIDLVPDFESEAPLERKVVSHEIDVLSEPDEREGGYRLYKLDGKSMLAKTGLFTVDIPAGHDHTILRAGFYPWLAGKARAAGATLETGAAVTHLLGDGESRVSGVATNNEEIDARVVIDCSGSGSALAQSAGLAEARGPRDMYAGLERVYRLEEDAVEERLRLKRGQGTAMACFGEFMKQVSGSGYIFTNRESVSVGVLLSMDSLVRAVTERFESVGRVEDVLESFESHPMVQELIDGAELTGSWAHNAPKGYRSILKRPYSDGYIAAGDTLGSFLRIGPLFDGMRPAIASGIMAAQSCHLAAESGSFRASNLSRYRQLLSPIYDDVSRSGRENFFSESGFGHSMLPRLLFSTSFFSKRAPSSAVEGARRGGVHAVTPPRPREGAGEEISVSLEGASKSSVKPWVPCCPAGCFALVTSEGRFTSYRELYLSNAKATLAEPEGRYGTEVRAYRKTVKDLEEGRLEFDPRSCVGCGTCWQIGPSGLVAWGRKREAPAEKGA